MQNEYEELLGREGKTEEEMGERGKGKQRSRKNNTNANKRQ